MFATHKIGQLASTIDKSEVVVGGIIRSVRTMLTKRGRDAGKRMAFVKLEDHSGSADCVLFASTYGEIVDLISEDNILFFKGELDKSRGAPNVKVSGAIALQDAPTKLTRSLRLRMETGDDFDMIIMTVKRLVKDHPGRIPVSIVINTPEHGDITISTGSSFGVTSTPQLIARLEDVLGTEAVAFN
jgi:DNA polymerase-3 subunit alpha